MPRPARPCRRAEELLEQGIEQTLDYMKRCGADEGHLVVMDRRSDAPRQDDGGTLGEADNGQGVAVWML